MLDGVGAGAMPDAAAYGDEGSHTLLHIHEKAGLKLPNLAALGLSGIIPLNSPATRGAWGIMAERSVGKDTTTGHWELAGIVLSQPFPTYPDGFPEEVIEEFCRKTGRGILCNKPYSGTRIIQELGDEHVATGKLIVYTSQDSVFQIAAHEEVVPVPELYRICEIARKILTGKHRVGRVIARPFAGQSGNYARTVRRHDYSVPPVAPTVLDFLKESGYETIGVGKIEDIFAAVGLTRSYPVKGNEACWQKTLELVEQKHAGFIFTNLVDFDMLYGHRNDPQGFAGALEWFDGELPGIYERMNGRDLLLITADHGNDPTTPSTDHSREYVPLLAYHHGLSGVVPLGIRESFTDVAMTIAENFGLSDKLRHGSSFLPSLR